MSLVIHVQKHKSITISYYLGVHELIVERKTGRDFVKSAEIEGLGEDLSRRVMNFDVHESVEDEVVNVTSSIEMLLDKFRTRNQSMPGLIN